MKCTIAGCPGVYEPQTVVHTVKHWGEVMVIDHVPAEVCNVCCGVLLTPETVRHIEAGSHSQRFSDCGFFPVGFRTHRRSRLRIDRGYH